MAHSSELTLLDKERHEVQLKLQYLEDCVAGTRTACILWMHALSHSLSGLDKTPSSGRGCLFIMTPDNQTQVIEKEYSRRARRGGAEVSRMKLVFKTRSGINEGRHNALR